MLGLRIMRLYQVGKGGEKERVYLGGRGAREGGPME